MAERQRLLPSKTTKPLESATTRHLRGLLDGKKQKKRRQELAAPKSTVPTAHPLLSWSVDSKKSTDIFGTGSLSKAPSFVRKELISTPRDNTKWSFLKNTSATERPCYGKKNSTEKIADAKRISQPNGTETEISKVPSCPHEKESASMYKVSAGDVGTSIATAAKRKRDEVAWGSETKTNTALEEYKTEIITMDSLKVNVRKKSRLADFSISAKEASWYSTITEEGMPDTTLPSYKSKIKEDDGQQIQSNMKTASKTTDYRKVTESQPISLAKQNSRVDEHYDSNHGVDFSVQHLKSLEPIPVPEKAAKALNAVPSIDNFIRLNMKNIAGSCRGARNRKFEPKSKQLWKKKQEDARLSATDQGNMKGEGQFGSFLSGSDPLDDYLDGVYQAQTAKKRFEGPVIPLCLGHHQPCKLLTVKKKNGNMGRHFYCCSMARGEQCSHFQWAEDTPEAARAALLKNSTSSGFIARQVSTYMERFKKLTVCELRDLAKKNGLNASGRKQHLLTRLSIWVRDQVASASCLSSDDNDHTTKHAAESDVCSVGCLSSEEDELEFFSRHDPAVSSAVLPQTIANDYQEDLQDHDRVSPDENRIHSSLNKIFGFKSFRDGQEWAVRRCLQKMKTLLVAPTGFGKSLCYALPASLMPGISIVVSPLLSLIQDQLCVMPPRVSAATLSGSMSAAQTAATIDDIIRGRIKILFVSPERLTSPSFRRMFRKIWDPNTGSDIREFPPVSLLCIDECHTLSQWAHNFRPAYLRIKSVIDLMKPASILAITATAGPRVVQDVSRTLEINSRDQECDAIKIMKVDRDNIDVKCFLMNTHEERLSKLIQLLKPSKIDVKKEGTFEGCLASGNVIIYVWRQRDAEAVAENIQAAGIQGDIVVYHGGMDSGAREKAQSKFMRGKARICVATIAFGLGVNKIDVEGVIHLYLSNSPEHYLQEIGRAGRDGRQAKAIALVLYDEVLVRHSLAHSDLVAKTQVEHLIAFLARTCKANLSSQSSERTWMNLAVPFKIAGAYCDCKPETVETLVSLLEQRLGEKPLVHVEGSFPYRGYIAPKRKSLVQLSSKEAICKAIIACGTCVEAPAGEKTDYENRGPGALPRSNIASHSFGCYAFSVAQCANLLGPTTEPRHVFAALRRLQSNGEIEFVMDTTEEGRALIVRIAPEGIATLSSEDKGIVGCLVDEIFTRFTSTVLSSTDKVLDMHFIATEVSERSSLHKDKAEGTDKSGSLALFQQLISEYFSAEGEGKSLAIKSDRLPKFHDCSSSKELINDCRSVLAQLVELQAASEVCDRISVDGSRTCDYTALAVTKFLHGIPSYNTPLPLVRNHPLFGRMQAACFTTLHQSVRELFRVETI